MKDSFIFEGKKYISARRASEISDYSSDYIGQLCRGEKLDCRMIGRSWFITEESLHLHKANVLHNEIYRNRIQNLKGKAADVQVAPAVIPAVAQTVITEPVVVKSAVTEPVVAQAAQVISPIATVSPVVPVAPVAVDVPVEVVATPVSSIVTPVEVVAPVAAAAPVTPQEEIVSEIGKSIFHTYKDIQLVYKDDKGPLMPEIAETRAHVRSEYVTPQEITRNVILRRVLASAAGALIVTIAVMVAISDPNSSGIASIIRGRYESLVALVGKNDQTNQGALSVNTASENDSVTNTAANSVANQDQQSQAEGIAIAPSSGSQSVDDAVKQKIQNSFSDQVEVRADTSGTAGVITPVFKDTQGKNFLYVLVPVKKTNPP